LAIQSASRTPEKVLFLVVVAYIIFLTLQVRRGQRTVLAEVVLGALGPFLTAYDQAGRFVEIGLRDYVWLRSAAVEAERLVEENRNLKGRLTAQGFCSEENARLKKLLEVEAPEGFTLVGARTLTQYGLPFNRFILLRLGPGVVAPDLTPVIVPEGVVGRVQKGAGGLRRCILITDPNSAVGVISQRTGVHGVAAGDGKNLLLRWVTNEADVKAGDLFMTSGDDGVFPPAIPVGVAGAVTDGPDYLKRAALRPSANLEDLEWVLLLLSAPPPASG
jgi:rod shape-determining protein MreC